MAIYMAELSRIRLLCQKMPGQLGTKSTHSPNRETCANVDTWEAWLTLAVAAGLLISLALRLAATDLLALACLGILVFAQNVSGSTRLPTPAQAVAGFGNEGLITIATVVRRDRGSGVYRRDTTGHRLAARPRQKLCAMPKCDCCFRSPQSADF